MVYESIGTDCWPWVIAAFMLGFVGREGVDHLRVTIGPLIGFKRHTVDPDAEGGADDGEDSEGSESERESESEGDSDSDSEATMRAERSDGKSKRD